MKIALKFRSKRRWTYLFEIIVVLFKLMLIFPFKEVITCIHYSTQIFQSIICLAYVYTCIITPQDLRQILQQPSPWRSPHGPSQSITLFPIRIVCLLQSLSSLVLSLLELYVNGIISHSFGVWFLLLNIMSVKVIHVVAWTVVCSLEKIGCIVLLVWIHRSWFCWWTFWIVSLFETSMNRMLFWLKKVRPL